MDDVNTSDRVSCIAIAKFAPHHLDTPTVGDRRPGPWAGMVWGRCQSLLSFAACVRGFFCSWHLTGGGGMICIIWASHSSHTRNDAAYIVVNGYTSHQARSGMQLGKQRMTEGSSAGRILIRDSAEGPQLKSPGHRHP